MHLLGTEFHLKKEWHNVKSRRIPGSDQKMQPALILCLVHFGDSLVRRRVVPDDVDFLPLLVTHQFIYEHASTMGLHPFFLRVGSISKTYDPEVAL